MAHIGIVHPGEMGGWVAATLAAAGLPSGFHDGAASVFAALADLRDAPVPQPTAECSSPDCTASLQNSSAEIVCSP